MTGSRYVMRVPWYPPMLIIAGAGTLLGSFMLTRQFLNPRMMIPIGAAYSIAAIGLGFYATAGQIREAVWHLRRLLIRGFSRPRGWFELARLAWMLLLFLVSTAVAVALIAWQQPVPGKHLSAAWACLMLAGGIVALIFLSSATVGYLLALLSWRLPRGRGFECTHFFYVIIVGVGLLGGAVSYYPPAAIWPDGSILAVGGLGGVGLLILGFVTIVVQYERREAMMKSVAKCAAHSVSSSGTDATRIPPV